MAGSIYRTLKSAYGEMTILRCCGVIFALCWLLVWPAFADPESEYLVIIGERWEVEQLRGPTPEEWAETLERNKAERQDGRFVISAAHYTTRLTYKVHEVLRGSHNDNFVTFTTNAAASYYESSDLKWVIFYFPIEGENSVGAPYFHDYVYPVKGGEFAGCGPTSDYVVFEDFSEVETLYYQAADITLPAEVKQEFVDPPKALWVDLLRPDDPRLDPNISEFEDIDLWTEEDFEDHAAEVAEDNETLRALLAPPNYDVDQEGVTCRVGLPADDIHQLTWQLYILPERRIRECRDELDTQDIDIPAYGSDGRLDEALRDQMSTCLSDKIKNDGRG